jgi:hypothetical protein
VTARHESEEETVYWLSRPQIRESIAEVDADVAAGRTFDEDEIRSPDTVQRWSGRRRPAPCRHPTDTPRSSTPSARSAPKARTSTGSVSR